MHIMKLCGIAAIGLLTSCDLGLGADISSTTSLAQPAAPDGLMGCSGHHAISTLQLADMNGDGRLDIVYTQGNTICMFTNVGGGHFIRAPLTVEDVAK